MFSVSLSDGVLALIVIAATALITLILDAIFGKRGSRGTLASLIAIVGLGIGGSLLVISNDISTSSLMVDWYAKYIAILVVALVALLIVSLVVYVDEHGYGFPIYSLLVFSALGIILIGMARDLVVLYLAWELMSIPSYALVAMNYRVREGAEAAFKYFVYGAISSALILYGISLLYGATGTLVIADIARAGESSLLYWGGIFILVGMGIKIGIVPLHMWIPDTYKGAPTLIAGYLSAITKIGSLIAIYKIANTILLPTTNSIAWIIAILSAITMTIGNIMALGQKNVVGMLAYSSIAHAGYLISILLTAIPGPTLLFYLTVFGIADLGAFIAVWSFKEYYGAVTIDDYNSISNKASLMAFATMIYLLSLTGIPPLAGFAGKFIIFVGLLDAGYLWLAVLIAINSAVSLGYYGRLIKRMYLDEPHKEPKDARIHAIIYIPVVLTLIFVIVLGVYPDLVFGLL